MSYVQELDRGRITTNLSIYLSDENDKIMDLQLCAALCHYGDDGKGHFVTFVPEYNNRRIIKISDHRVSVATESEIICIDHHSYILAYGHIQGDPFDDRSIRDFGREQGIGVTSDRDSDSIVSGSSYKESELKGGLPSLLDDDA